MQPSKLLDYQRPDVAPVGAETIPRQTLVDNIRRRASPGCRVRMAGRDGPSGTGADWRFWRRSSRDDIVACDAIRSIRGAITEWKNYRTNDGSGNCINLREPCRCHSSAGAECLTFSARRLRRIRRVSATGPRALCAEPGREAAIPLDRSQTHTWSPPAKPII